MADPQQRHPAYRIYPCFARRGFEKRHKSPRCELVQSYALRNRATLTRSWRDSYGDAGRHSSSRRHRMILETLRSPSQRRRGRCGRRSGRDRGTARRGVRSISGLLKPLAALSPASPGRRWALGVVDVPLYWVSQDREIARTSLRVAELQCGAISIRSIFLSKARLCPII